MKVYKLQVSKLTASPVPLEEVLRKISKLPTDKIAEACEKGAVWLQRNSKGKILRERDPRRLVGPADTVTLNYDEHILELKAPVTIECLYDGPNYSVWSKPAGVVTQGSPAGDHASLLRFVEMRKKKEVYLIHRLDRETEGLVVVGHTSEAAAKLGDLFQKNAVEKIYEAIVLGSLTPGTKRTIDESLEDQKAVTHFEVIDSGEERSKLSVRLETGRLHQIRRHLQAIGHPVIGDPKYGSGNKNRAGLQLLARTLGFKDPWDHKLRSWTLEKTLNL